MRFYLYTTNKRTSETEAVIREFDSIESAQNFANGLANGFDYCQKQFGRKEGVKVIANIHGTDATFVIESALRKEILSTQTTLERIFGKSKYAPLDMIAMEKRLIEEATKREDAELEMLANEACEAEREAELLNMSVIDYLCSKL